VRVPIVVTCECGHTTEAYAGEVVTCACGRRYATELSQAQSAAIRAMGTRLQVFARLGIGVVGLLSLAAILTLGTYAGVAVLAVLATIWWVVLQPMWRRRLTSEIARLPPGTIQPL
jgi:hypothetical protein